METFGIVHGNHVVLEEIKPGFDGRRVRVRLDILGEERVLSSAEQMHAWREWVESGPQGPIVDESDGWP